MGRARTTADCTARMVDEVRVDGGDRGGLMRAVVMVVVIVFIKRVSMVAGRIIRIIMRLGRRRVNCLRRCQPAASSASTTSFIGRPCIVRVALMLMLMSIRLRIMRVVVRMGTTIIMMASLVIIVAIHVSAWLMMLVILMMILVLLVLLVIHLPIVLTMTAVLIFMSGLYMQRGSSSLLIQLPFELLIVDTF